MTPDPRPYVDVVLAPDLNDPPPNPCCDRTGFCGCGEYLTVGYPHAHVYSDDLVVSSR